MLYGWTITWWYDFFLSSSGIPVDFLFLCWEKKHMFSSPYYENLLEFDFSISSQCNLFYCTFKKIEFSVHYILVLIWKDYFKDYFKAVILGFHCIAFQFRCSSFVIHMFCLWKASYRSSLLKPYTSEDILICSHVFDCYFDWVLTFKFKIIFF